MDTNTDHVTPPRASACRVHRVIIRELVKRPAQEVVSSRGSACIGVAGKMLGAGGWVCSGVAGGVSGRRYDVTCVLVVVILVMKIWVYWSLPIRQT